MTDGPFLDYLRRPQPNFSCDRVGSIEGGMHYRLTSQNWQGENWQHDVAWVGPGHGSVQGAILEVTGGEINQVDLDRARIAADQSGLPVVVLWGVPNQPRWDLIEDALIAYTIEQYLSTGDPTWPLLFPMARSVISAMDAFIDVRAWMVTGSSKRGWTSWLAAASGDPRVVGIAPRVFDHLNMEVQVAHQLAIWGRPSPMLNDYEARGLIDLVSTEEGKAVAKIIDPYTYLESISIPKLIVNGVNDAYWTVDAGRNYVFDLIGPTHIVNVPNGGHWIGDPALKLSTLARFARHVLLGESFPQIDLRTGQSKESPASVSRWSALAPSPRFTDALWTESDDGTLDLEPGSFYQAAYLEARFDKDVRLCTAPILIPKQG